MPGTLEIRVNHERPNTFEVPDTFETTENFELEIRNEGKPVHMHLNLDDDLHAGMSMETGNHFIPRRGTISLPVEVDDTKRPFHGKCRISTGYGAETKFVEIRVFEPEQDQEVTVDERLSQPPAREAQRGPQLDELGVLALLALAFLALLGAAIIVAVTTTPLVGVIVFVLVLVIAVSVYVAIGER